VAAVPRRGARRQAAAPRAGLARATRDRGGGRLDDDPDPRLVEREGEARARVDAALDLARRLPPWPVGGRAAGRACGRIVTGTVPRPRPERARLDWARRP